MYQTLKQFFRSLSLDCFDYIGSICTCYKVKYTVYCYIYMAMDGFKSLPKWVSLIHFTFSQVEMHPKRAYRCCKGTSILLPPCLSKCLPTPWMGEGGGRRERRKLPSQLQQCRGMVLSFASFHSYCLLFLPSKQRKAGPRLLVEDRTQKIM